MAITNSVEELGLCVLHIGINADGEEDGKKMAEQFRTWMGFIPDENPNSIFASPLIEIMKFGGPGRNRHPARLHCPAGHSRLHLLRPRRRRPGAGLGGHSGLRPILGIKNAAADGSRVFYPFYI